MINMRASPVLGSSTAGHVAWIVERCTWRIAWVDSIRSFGRDAVVDMENPMRATALGTWRTLSRHVHVLHIPSASDACVCVCVCALCICVAHRSRVSRW
jgi:hypothetical protein